MILAFAHPGLVVPDLDAARDFYAAMFGFSVVGEECWADNPVVDEIIGSVGSASRGLMMAGHNCFLELFEYTAPPQGEVTPGQLGPHEPGIRHLAFYVDDCRAEFERLLSLGGQVLGDPRGGAVYCRDPFGNIVELCEIPADKEDPRELPGLSGLSGS
jgi:catechol 2,3-dioxygenase-like lactoylglutathione lyase family enzyme